MERSLLELRDELDKEALARNPEAKRSTLVGMESIIIEHDAEFWTELSPEGRQHVVVEDFIREWRRRIGDIGRARISFLYKEGATPYDIEVDLSHSDPSVLASAASK